MFQTKLNKKINKQQIEYMQSRKWDIESIITDVYPWEQLPQAIEKASSVDEALNVIIHYQNPKEKHCEKKA